MKEYLLSIYCLYSKIPRQYVICMFFLEGHQVPMHICSFAIFVSYINIVNDRKHCIQNMRQYFPLFSVVLLLSGWVSRYFHYRIYIKYSNMFTNTQTACVTIHTWVKYTHPIYIIIIKLYIFTINYICFLYIQILQVVIPKQNTAI